MRQARKEAHLTLDGLAAKAGTSRQHLIRLEAGAHKPTPEMVARIADATGKDESFFEFGDDDEEADPVASLMTALRRVVRDELGQRVKAS